MSDREISEVVGCDPATVHAVRHKLGIIDTKPHFRKHDTGKSFIVNGYIHRYLPSLSKDNKGCILEHRLVVEQALGRELNSNELVHHINGIKSDNRLENLMIVARGEHIYEEVPWKLFWWAKDNPAEAKELADKLIPCAPSETKRLDPEKGCDSPS